MRSESIAAFAVALTLLAGGAAHADALSPQAFAKEVAASDAFEIASSNAALQTSRNEKVKAFAGDMLKQHQESTQDLKQAAQKDGVAIDATLPKELQEKLQALKGASGPTFDAAYLSAQVSIHTKAVSLFDRFAKDGKGGALKAFAQNMLPVIRTHLVRAQGLSSP